MRPKERIPIFLNNIDLNKLEERWDIDIPQTVRGLIFSKPIRRYWLKNPDQRFGQILINLEYIPDRLTIWMDDDLDILINQGCEPREVMFWGKSYDKDMNPLPEIEWILIKDMTTDHIKAILKDVEENRMGIRKDYKEVFENEIKLRENEK